MVNVSRSVMVLRAGLLAGGLLAVALPAPLAAANDPKASAPEGWTVFRDQRLGFELSYPTDVYEQRSNDPTASIAKITKKRSGKSLLSKDNRSWLVAASFANTTRQSVEGYRSRALSTSYAKARVTYNRLTSDSYVLSGFRGMDIFYERATFSCGGRVINVWTMTYPLALRTTYDPIVETVSRTFRPATGAACK